MRDGKIVAEFDPATTFEHDIFVAAADVERPKYDL
jgi:hypothetical protein